MIPKNKYNILPGNVVEIILTQGQMCLIDLEDLPLLGQYRWCAHRHKHTWYAVTSSGSRPYRTTISMHNILMGVGKRVDHRNGNGLDNRRQNLRRASQAQNTWNRKPLEGKASKYKGVHTSYKPGFWRARIMHEGKVYNLGEFDNEYDAAKAYNTAAIKFFGEFAKLNSAL